MTAAKGLKRQRQIRVRTTVMAQPIKRTVRTQTARTIRTIQPVRMIQAVQAVQAIQAIRAVRAVRAVRAIRAIRAVQTVQAIRIVRHQKRIRVHHGQIRPHRTNKTSIFNVRIARNRGNFL